MIRHVPPPKELTAERHAQLRAHLAEFGASAVNAAAGKIAAAYRLAAWQMDAEPWLRSQWGPEAKRSRQHHCRIAKRATELRELLDLEAPHGGMSELTSKAGYELSWDPLRVWLDLLAKVAAEEAATHRPPPRGRRKLRWRDEFIRAVWEAHPNPTKTCGGNCETLIGMLLGWLGEHLDATAVHDATLGALQH
jgi:hypothetical protein